jgi:hypothetical protein
LHQLLHHVCMHHPSAADACMLNRRVFHKMLPH